MRETRQGDVHELETRVSQIGSQLRDTLRAVLEALPGESTGPQGLATSLGLDKVLTSRLLKAARSHDPIAVAHNVPGPEPMKRFYRAAKRKGAHAELVSAGERAVEKFQSLIREELGDRSSLDAILSSWLPQLRQEFELRRMQSAFKAMSQLKGVSVRVNFGTVLLHPSAGGDALDVVWIVGLLGLQRWRPNARIKLATRRFAARKPTGNGSPAREPLTLGGEAVEDLEGLRLDAFCEEQPAKLDVRRVGETTQYLLADEGVGRKAVRDLLFAEVNRAELRSTPEPGRRGYVFAEIASPSHLLHFDVLVHEDVYRGYSAELAIYDTTLDGAVDINDPTRTIDRLDLGASLQELGPGLGTLRSPNVPQHRELLEHVFASLGWNPSEFRCYRSEIDYPLYGSQVVVSFAR